MSPLVDTNVVSDLIRRSPDPAAAGWAAARPPHELFFSAIGEVELRYGAAILAAGRRRDTLTADIERMTGIALIRPLSVQGPCDANS